MIRLLRTNGEGTVDVTQLTQSITWSGDITQCARTLEAELVTAPTDPNVPAVACGLGDGFCLLQDDRELFSGYLFSRYRGTDQSRMTITCFDRGIYLNKNRAGYRFSGMTPEAVARRICSDFGIETGEIAATGVPISRNFVDVTLYDMIQTAYTLASEATGKHYFIRFVGARLCVMEKRITGETLIIEGGSNLMSASATDSVEDMVNRVSVYNTDGELVGAWEDAEAIRLYGRMQGYLRQGDGEDVSLKAKELLDAGGVSQKITLQSLGNIASTAGGTVVVREPYTGLYGLFYIDSDVHTWKNGRYYNKLVLNFRSIMDEKEAGSLPNATGARTKGKGAGVVEDSRWRYIDE